MAFEWIRKTIVALVVVAAVGTASAYALPITLTLQSGASNFTITDGSALDANPAAGVITFIGAVGTFNINVTSGLAGSAAPGSVMDLNSVNAGGPGTLTIIFNEQGIMTAPTSFAVTFGGTLTGPAGSSIAGVALYDPANGACPPCSGNINIGIPLVFGPGAFSGSTGGGFVATGPYSVTAGMILTATGRVTYSGDLNVAPVPEPSSLILLGTGLAGFAVWARKKKGQQASK